MTEVRMDIAAESRRLKEVRTRGNLGALIALLVLSFPAPDLHRMIHNFSLQLADVEPEYRARITEKVSEHLLGTYRRIRLMHEQGAFPGKEDPVDPSVPLFWEMVEAECQPSPGKGDRELRFLKFLLAAFAMFVLREPAHPVGTPFPGGDTVQLIQGVYLCPVRKKANDVGGALCPFCPAVQTPAIGYLKPPLHPTERQKQEFIRNCYDFHNFNG